MTSASLLIRTFGAVILLCLISIPQPAQAQSLFGFPGRHFGGFGDFDDFHGLGRSGSPYHRRHQDYYRPACPQYKPMQLSDWQQQLSAEGVVHKLQAVLPGVSAEDRRTQLSADGRQLELFGVRPVLARGRARAPECLPRSARVSGDGRYEILETSVPLPEGADVSRATLRRYGAHGVEVTVPSRQQEMPSRSARQEPFANRHAAESDVKPPPRPQSQPVKPAARPQSQPAKVQVAADRRRPTKRAPPQLKPRPQVVLPPSDGIEVVEEEYLYPEKQPDASSGWTDNRGEFQSY